MILPFLEIPKYSPLPIGWPNVGGYVMQMQSNAQWPLFDGRKVEVQINDPVGTISTVTLW